MDSKKEEVLNFTVIELPNHNQNKACLSISELQDLINEINLNNMQDVLLKKLNLENKGKGLYYIVDPKKTELSLKKGSYSGEKCIKIIYKSNANWNYEIIDNYEIPDYKGDYIFVLEK